MRREIEELNIHDFTFAILGQCTDHYDTEVDELLGSIWISRIEVIEYLRKRIGSEDLIILEAIKSDMNEAFEDFFVRYTSVENPNTGIFRGLIPAETTRPNEINYLTEKGREISLIYEDEIITTSDGEEFDVIPLIDAHLKSLGLPPMKDLDYQAFARTLAYQTPELFRRLQKEHFEQFTFYKVATDYLNNRIDALTSSNKITHLPGIDNLVKSSPSPSIKENTSSMVMPKILIDALKGTKGKKTALIIKAALKLGCLPLKPNFTFLKEYGVEGTPDGYNRYFNPSSNYILREDEIDTMMDYLRNKM